MSWPKFLLTPSFSFSTMNGSRHSPNRMQHQRTMLAWWSQRAFLSVVAPFLWASTPALSAGANPAVKPLGCLIEPDRVTNVGSQVVGIVERMHVKRGDLVQAGQVLISLRSDVERASAYAARTRASVDAEILAAKTGVTLAEIKQSRAEALLAQNFVSPQAVELARGELEVARQKLKQVQGQQKIWIEERGIAEAQLELRTVRSPFAGVVVERFVNAGERVDDRPLMRLAVIDPLRVELLVPTAQFGTVKRGDSVAVSPELPGAQTVSATVTHVDHVLDAASNSFRVQLTLPNPSYSLPAGLRCKADLSPISPTAKEGLKFATQLAWPPNAPTARSRGQ